MMKYKTLFRVLLKVVGVWLFAEGILLIFSNVFGLMISMFDGFADGDLYFLVYSINAVPYIAIGLYLFFGGKWIADLAIPGNRPYCHECGYDLSHISGAACPECGTTFQRDDAHQPKDELLP